MGAGRRAGWSSANAGRSGSAKCAGRERRGDAPGPRSAATLERHAAAARSGPRGARRVGCQPAWILERVIRRNSKLAPTPAFSRLISLSAARARTPPRVLAPRAPPSLGDGHDARARRVGLARPRARHPSLVFSRGSPSPVLPRDFTTRTPSGIPRVVVAPRRVRSRRLRVPRPGRVLHARRQARGEHVVHRGRLPHDRGGAAPRERVSDTPPGTSSARASACASRVTGANRDVVGSRASAFAAAERAAPPPTPRSSPPPLPERRLLRRRRVRLPSPRGSQVVGPAVFPQAPRRGDPPDAARGGGDAPATRARLQRAAQKTRRRRCLRGRPRRPRERTRRGRPPPRRDPRLRVVRRHAPRVPPAGQVAREHGPPRDARVRVRGEDARRSPVGAQTPRRAQLPDRHRPPPTRRRV